MGSFQIKIEQSTNKISVNLFNSFYLQFVLFKVGEARGAGDWVGRDQWPFR